ncbi:MAG: glycoside hydrolase/phage tail family protein, partial [Rubrimonas sp.]
AWSVAGVTRPGAQVVSIYQDKPKFGSTAADASVREAIAAIKAAGLRVMIYPFVQMDIPAGNGLPDPYGAAEQQPYPWRGRITSTADGTAACAAEVAAFFDRANGYRRFVRHLAQLATDAGGVDAFAIGTELRGLTWLRDGAGGYPAVQRLRALAAEVRPILGAGCKIGYAADWSEYFGHQPQDGSGDVIFHLDPLWADDEIDWIGIDNYMPLTDWRDGVDHADYDPAAGVTTPYALSYLQANVEGGEGFEWFYASPEDRAAQLRTPVTDGAYGEPWVFRVKDIRSWWSLPHHDRPGGVRAATPTAWAPMSKPIWFTEIGCGAVDKGGNQPNLFFDPASSESGLPYFSSGKRDDYMQRRFLQAALSYWADPERNPVSPIYGAPMVATEETTIWTYDNRPWPEFPDDATTWSDASNYRGGHWLRLGRAPAAEAIRERLRLEGVDLAEVDLSQCHGQADGFATDRAMSFREWLTPWEGALRLDVFESFGRLVFQSRAAAPTWGAITPDDVAEGDGPSRYRLTRTSVEDPRREIVLGFVDSGADWQRGAARDSIRAGDEDGLAEAEVALAMDLERAETVATAWLRDVTEQRETLEFTAPPSWADLEAGRPFAFAVGGRLRPFMVEAVTEGAARRVTARSFDQAALQGGLAGPSRPAPRVVTATPAPPVVAFLDLPQLTPDADPVAGYVAAHAEPFVGVDLYRAAEQGGPYELREALGARTPMGRLAAPLAPASADRWTPGPLVARLFAGELLTQAEGAVLGGAGALAVEVAPGAWEVVQFVRAELTGPGEWTLRQLLRGRLGTEAAAAMGAPAGARVVTLGRSLAQPVMGAAEIGRAWWWRALPSGRDLLSGA